MQESIIYDTSNELEELFAEATIVEDDGEEEKPKGYPHTCKYCGKIYYTHMRRSADCCKDDECIKQKKKDYNKHYREVETDEQAVTRRQRERWRMYHKRRRDSRKDERLEHELRMAKQDEKFAKYGARYGDYQKEKLLASVPKIDVRL